MSTLAEKLADYVRNNTPTVKCGGHEAPMMIACPHCTNLHPGAGTYAGRRLILPYSENGLVGCESCYSAMSAADRLDRIKPIILCLDCVRNMVIEARARGIPVFCQTKCGSVAPLR